MNEARLQEAYQRALAKRDDGTRTSCVPLESIHALARGDLSEPKRVEILAHVMSCRSCQRELDLLRAIESAGAKTGANTGITPIEARRGIGAFPWRVIVPVALAASLVVAAFIGVQDRLGRGPIYDIPRGGATGLTLVVPNDGAAFTAPGPLTFTWRSEPDARSYVLEVLSGSGEVVLTRTTSDTALTVTETASFRRGADYQWWVRASSPSGQRASAMRRFRIQSP